MVQIDWKKMMAITPESMTEEEKDELYETVAWYSPDTDLSKKYLVHFVRVVQEILKFKSEQYESLMNELDDIAAKQGEEEARRRQDLIDEIEDLKEQLEYHKRLDQDSGRPMPATHEELRSEIVKLEMQNEELLFELQEREKELMNEKTEMENFASQVATLEREKLELMRELTALQEETTEKNSKNYRDSPEYGPEKQEELTEIIRQKNKHISQLLDDIDVVEKENLSLRTKLNNVKDELAETTTYITEMTGEMSRLRHSIEDYAKKISLSEEQKKGLKSQIDELVEEKAKHDKQLDEFAVTLNTKVSEWRDILDSKDKEIIKCKEEIKRLMSSSNMLMSSDFTDPEVNQKILQQEEEIKVLKRELLKATEELNKCSELIENLKEKKGDGKNFDGGLVEGLEDKVRYLEEKLRYAEEDAHAKAEEMSELVIQLREYEAGEFGLSDAVARIKKLEKTVQKKDLQVEKLIESCNNLEIEFENLEEQNMTLRERLGLSASDEIDTSHVKLKFKKDVEMIENLKLQLEKKEEDLIKVKLKNRKLIKYLKLKPPVSLDSVSSDDSRSDGGKAERYKQENLDLEKKLLSIMKENEALRKGMHEILESIHNQDSSGVVEVQSACLERLLDALDSRHISGWYHPAMRLQAQLKSMEGKNEELRNQIRSLRIEYTGKSKELEEASLKVQSLESDLLMMEGKSRSKSSEPEAEEEEEDGEINMKNVTNIEQEQKIIELEMELQQLKFLYDKKNVETGNLEYSLKTEKEELNLRIVELEEQAKGLKSGKTPDEEQVAEATSSVTNSERKISYLQQVVTALRSANEKLREEMIETEERILQEVIRVQTDKLSILLKVENLEKKVLKSVAKEKFDLVNKELTEVTLKYQQAVNLSMTKYDDGSIEKLQNEVALLEREKQDILDELRIVKEKLTAVESAVNGDAVTQDAFSNEISILSGKLAASEVRELNEKQKCTHLENVNLMIRSELEELESHNKDLSDYISKLTDANSKLQETERELRQKIVQNESEEEYSVLLEKFETLHNKYKELLVEKENVQELFEISQNQCRSLQNWRDMDKMEMASQNEQILLLQSSNDDKMVIARLSHELLTSQLTGSQLTKKNNDLQNRLSKLLTQNICLESKIDENRREVFEFKQKHLFEIEYLYEVINDVRKLYSNVTMFPDVERIYNTKIKLESERRELKNKMDEVKIKLHESSIKQAECEVQLDSLEDLKSALKGDSKNLITWHNRSTEFRLKEARYRRQNEFLIGEMSQLEKCLKKLNEEITIMEEKNIEREKSWEQKQVLWEESQYELCQLLQDKGIKRSPTPIVTYCDQGTDADSKSVSTENIEHFVRIIDDQTEAIKKYESQIQDLENEVLRLKKESDEKETIIMLKDKLMNNSKPKTLELEETVSRDKIDEAEKAALKVTVQSLQNIIKQKEETIFRYQDLLKESRDEYSKASGKLQEELRTLHETLTNQSKAFNKLKNSVQTTQQSKDNLPMALEKYITKIHELEDELVESRSNLTNANSQLYAVQQEADRWRNVAEDRLLLMEDMRQRLEVEYRNEMENFKEEIQAYQGEIDHLKQLLDATHGDLNRSHNHKLMETIQQLQMKLLQYEGTPSKKTADWMYDKSLKNKTVQAQREIESLKRQLKFSKDESSRLRDQIRLLQLNKPRRPRTGSSTTRSGSDSKNSLKEESLLSKIKTLEELLQISKERERELLESGQQRIKSAEEVARWDEKKRCQQTIDQLNSKLKEKDVEIEVLKNKNESFRNMIHRCERERGILETQLKAAKGGPGGPTAKIEKLKTEKLQLQAEVTALRNQLDDQQRHGTGVGVALLHEKLECQERKLAVLELASQGREQIITELERLKTINTSLEKVNLKLESDNLSLSLYLEKEKGEVKRLTERNRQLEKLATLHEATENVSELHQIESDRTISSLHQTIEKLTADNKRLRSMQTKDVRPISTTDKVRKELLKLKEEHKNLRAKYLQVIDRNSSLEDELKKCRYQIHLLEDKDLAESISKTNNLQLASDLSQELLQVKSQLAHKTHLLERVKVLLTKAASKEKALNEQVTALQSILPASAIGEN